MSGNFTQRAKGAIMDKYSRAKVAVLSGADVVVNLPTAYSINNAEVFSLSAVKIANSFKSVKWLSFGMEEPDVFSLEQLADFFINEPNEYKLNLKKHLSLGLSFNESRVKAVKELIKDKKVTFKNNKKVIKILTMPNNILALEYVKALKQINSQVAPFAIKRIGSNYNDKKLLGKFSSATAIRNTIYKTNKVKVVKKSLPIHSYNELKKFIKQNNVIDNNKLNEYALYKIRTTKQSDLKNIYNVTEGLENRLKSVANLCSDANKFAKSLQTKRYKISRTNSIILNSVLNIQSQTVQKIYSLKKLPYIKVLAVNTATKQILSSLKCSSNLILRKSDVDNLKHTKFVKELNFIENNSNAVYNLLIGKNILPAKDIYHSFIKVHKKSE
jgi:predicted nucleotidyltransferase